MEAMVEVMPVMTLKMCTTGRQINGTRALCLDALVEMLRWLDMHKPRTEHEPRGCLRSQVLWRSCIITTVSFTLLCTGNVHDLNSQAPGESFTELFFSHPCHFAPRHPSLWHLTHHRPTHEAIISHSHVEKRLPSQNWVGWCRRLA